MLRSASRSTTMERGGCRAHLLLVAASAKARGVRFGRPPAGLPREILVANQEPALTAHQRQEAIQRLAEGVTQADLARAYSVSQATKSRLHPLPFEDSASVGGA
jgi:DNA invertase Pin-like site-specific DNA recombinase